MLTNHLFHLPLNKLWIFHLKLLQISSTQFHNLTNYTLKRGLRQRIHLSKHKSHCRRNQGLQAKIRKWNLQRLLKITGTQQIQKCKRSFNWKTSKRDCKENLQKRIPQERLSLQLGWLTKWCSTPQFKMMTKGNWELHSSYSQITNMRTGCNSILTMWLRKTTERSDSRQLHLTFS